MTDSTDDGRRSSRLGPARAALASIEEKLGPLTPAQAIRDGWRARRLDLEAYGAPRPTLTLIEGGRDDGDVSA